MSTTTDYCRINVGVYLHPEEFKITEKGIDWNPYFQERHSDYQAYFTSILEEALVEQVGPNGWAIQMVQVSQETGKWFVDLFLDNSTLSAPLVAKTRSLLTEEFKLQFFVRGTLHDYLHL